jgi:hypothetical protein
MLPGRSEAGAGGGISAHGARINGGQNGRNYGSISRNALRDSTSLIGGARNALNSEAHVPRRRVFSQFSVQLR